MTRRETAITRAVALVALGLVSIAQTVYFYRSVVDYRAHFPEMPGNNELRKSPGLARNVLVVVVDGLRIDASYNMGTLNLLRDLGMVSISIVGLPSLSLPGDAVLFTGSWQEFSGVTTNWYKGPGPDSVFDEAKSSNLTTSTVGYGSVDMMFGRSIDMKTGYDQDRDILGQCLELMTNGSYNLMAVHFSSPDHEGHLHGGRSDQYMKAVADIDGYIAEILKHLNLNDSVVIITSDHGHRDEGGHGGREREVVETPLVIAGRGIRHVGLGHVNQTDVAPTISVILGIPIPSLCQGRPLVQAIDVDGAERDLLLELNAEQKSNLYARYRIFLDLDDTILGPANSSNLSALMEEVGEARQERITLERERRLPWLVAICILPLAYLFRRVKRLAMPLLGLALYISLDNLFYKADSNLLTISAFNSEGVAIALICRWISEVVVALLIVSFAVSLLSREGGERPEDVMTDTMITIFEAMLIQTAYLIYINPIGVTWALPNPDAWFDYLLKSFRMSIIGLTSPIFMWLTRLIHKQRGRSTSLMWHRPSQT